jgi:hypothetical protein
VYAFNLSLHDYSDVPQAAAINLQDCGATQRMNHIGSTT